MQKLTRQDLFSLEEYAKKRQEFRAEVMAHKKQRIVQLGPNLTLHFEDRKTMQYQIQEMLRVERIFEEEGIEEELSTYNSLIPDGSNWKATMMVEFADPDKRQEQLTRLVGIENKVWVQVEGFERICAIADEDLERTTEEKTSAVHFLRFELTPAMAEAVQGGVSIGVGVDHLHYSHQIKSLPEAQRDSLAQDILLQRH